MNNENIYIHHFSIMAPEDVIEKVVNFYGDVLGLAPGRRPDFGLPGYWLYADARPIIHLTVQASRGEGAPGYLHHLALRCRNMDDVIRRLEKNKIAYRKTYVAAVRQTQLIVTDPAGTPVELNFAEQ